MIGRFASFVRRNSDSINRIPSLAARSPRVRKLIGALLLCSIVGLTYRSYFRNWVPLGPQRTVATINPKMGVHTRLTDEPDAAKVKRSLEMVREMGASWIVEYFPWAYYEPRRGQYEWSHPDMVIDHANRQGLTVIARLGYVPEWARPEDSHHLYLAEENYEAFGRYAVEFVRRYQGKVGYLIIWNEPNLSLEWGFRPVDPASYVEMLKVVYPMVKAAAPEVQVLAGALAPTLDPPGSEWSMNDLDYLQRMYDAGAGDYFDILAIHAYGLGFEADEPAGESVVNFRRSELLREIMVRNGDSDKTAMITEGGWNDHPRWTRAVRPAQRILNSVQAYEIARTEWPWLESVSLWVFRFPWDQKSYQDNYTFVSTDFEPKAIYLEMLKYAKGRFDAP